ncbi:arylamine N-acetyltransferase family protein [Paralcaligenes ginsengisoli]
MTHALNLNAYLARIGYSGTLEASLPVLRTLALHHAQIIPFENLSPFLGLPVSLDLADVERKLVHEGRGGYCFEQNLLFGQALRGIGFDVTDLAARVLWTQPDDAKTARTHMLLAVDLGGEPYLVDVGFGGQTLTGVLRLQADIPQATPHGDFRLLRDDGQWRMQSRIQGEWRSLYRFDLSPQYAVDYEITNYYLSTHPRSHFTQNLIAARPTPLARLALQNRDYAVHAIGGESTRRRLESTREILQVLADDFGIVLPDTPTLIARLDALL